MELIDNIIRLEFAPFIALLCAALMCGLVGAFLVVKRSSMMVDAIGHAVFPGIVIGTVISIHIEKDIVLIAGVSTAFLVYGLVIAFRRGADISSNICIFYTGSFALGVMALHIFHLTNSRVGIHMLYGSIDTIFWPQLDSLEALLSYKTWSNIPAPILELFIAFLYVCVSCYVFFNGIIMTSFDRLYSSTVGVRGHVIELVFMSIVAMSCVVTFSTVGIISAIALYVCPSVISGVFFNNNPRAYLLGAVVIAVTITIVGYIMAGLLPVLWGYSLPLDTSGFVAALFGVCVLVSVMLDAMLSYNDSKARLYS